jgi:hypothetical protein
MTTVARCPICGALPKMHFIKTGFALSCVGQQHYAGLDDEGKHAVSLHRQISKEEALENWNKAFGRAGA